MNSRPTVLVAGATGYIGGHVVRAMHDAGYRVRALARDEGRLGPVRDACDEVFVGEATRTETLEGLCDGIDVVVSALGPRTFRARPTPEEVDLRANLNILERARDAGARHLVFVGVLRADELMEEAPILRPREEFVRRLKGSGLRWTVLRPTGAFNDMAGIFRLAERGWGLVLGDGEHRINPVHAADIAGEAVRSITDPSLRDAEFGFGGPETYTQAGIARLASRALGKPQRIVRVPYRIVDAAVAIIRPFNRNAAGFLELFRRAASREAVGTPVGSHGLWDFYRSLARETEGAEASGTARSRPSGALRAAFRLPIHLYRHRLGWLLGHRVLLLTHRGRRSGLVRQTPLEVVRHDPATGESVVVSAWGERADWYRNIETTSALEVRTGRERYVPEQRFLSPEEAYAEISAYERDHPLLARILPRWVGLRLDGTERARRRFAGFARMVVFRPTSGTS
jgi:deazaflavin-dependent oxidoreductase (nitroreductase family)